MSTSNTNTNKLTEKQDFVQSLRLASPYIVEYQDKSFLIILNERLFQADNQHQFIEDLLLLHRIGNHLFFIPDLNQPLNQPIDEKTRDELIALEQKLWQQFQALWFKHHQKADLIKTNLLQVRPQGVKSGKDFLYASKVQGVFNTQLQPLLAQQWAIWLSSWGHSFAGVPYILNPLDIATEIAKTVHCDKLIYLDTKDLALDTLEKANQSMLSNSLSLYQAQSIKTTNADTNKIINIAVSVCKSGIQRFHFLNIEQDGALLCELFTRDGFGLLVYNDIYDELMIADESCTDDIVELVNTLSENGSVLHRNKEFIENNLSDFYVMRRENKVIACVALHAINNTNEHSTQAEIAEIACLIVHPQYQSMGIASQLIQHLTQQAKKQHLKQLIALTVEAQGWFQRHGFKKISPQKLPQISNKIYDHQRNSTIYYREI